MLRFATLLTWAALDLSSGCTHSSRRSTPSDAGPGHSPSAQASVQAAAGQWLTPSVFSAPIAATRVADAAVVAGLVVAEGSLRAMKMAGEKILWTSTALGGVAWAPDSELRLQAGGEGTALVWHGLRNGKSGRTLVVLGPRGETLGDPIEIGTAFCGTRTGVVWLDPHKGGAPTHVRSRGWSEAAIRDMMAVPADRDPGLVCGDQDVVVLGDGDDDLTASIFAAGEPAAQRPWIAIRDSDFGDDDEREHDSYSTGDDLVLVRIGGSGSIAIREVLRRGPPGRWQRLKHALAADDDVVAVDGDAGGTLIVFTREANQTCPDSGVAAESVRALRVDRKAGEESLMELAPADCAHSRGPFWIASAAGVPIVAWVERFTSPPPTGPPIAGLAFRVLGSGGLRSGTIQQPADALTDASCEDHGCWAAALLRTLSPDGLSPGAIRLFGYP